ncbi:ParB/RepB/Spo0J family partition protein [Aeromonas caviae]|uniref:ParB/RepB/Spo0J family partition protein n=1 Tax=Aeromonas caviae TaxID=648 RepID=UPI003F7A63BC
MSAAEAMKKKGGLNLGKLSALATAAKGIQAGQEVLKVHHSECYSTKQVRVQFSAIENLSESMKKKQLQPCKVWPKDDKGYRICIGERRWRAAVHGDLYLDVIVDPLLAELSSAEVILYQLTENTQRENLTPREEAQAVEQMLAEGMKPGEIAMAKSAIEAWSEPTAASWVSRMRKLLKMPAIVEALHDGGLHDAETLNCLTAIYELSPAACEAMISEGLTTRKATRTALKALKAGDPIPGITKKAEQAETLFLGPVGLQTATYSVDVDRLVDGKFAAVVHIKMAGHEVKASWLTDPLLVSEHLFDVKVRVLAVIRSFMQTVQDCCTPEERTDYESIMAYWQLSSSQNQGNDQPPVDLTSGQGDKLPPVDLTSGQGDKLPPVEQTSGQGDKLPPVEQTSGQGDKLPPVEQTNGQGDKLPPVEQTNGQGDKLPPVEQANSQGNKQTPVEQANGQGNKQTPVEVGCVSIHGFVDDDPVVLCLDVLLPGNEVMVQDKNGQRYTIPSEDFTLSHIAKA